MFCVIAMSLNVSLAGLAVKHSPACGAVFEHVGGVVGSVRGVIKLSCVKSGKLKLLIQEGV